MKAKARHKLKTGQWSWRKYAKHTTKDTMLLFGEVPCTMKEWRNWFMFGYPGRRIWVNGRWVTNKEHWL